MKIHGIPFRFLTSFLLAGFVGANANAQALQFPADLNNLQPLSQRFLYALSGPDQLRMGDLLIESQQISLSIISTEPNKNRFQFRWPAGLLTTGTVALLGSNGRALWSSNFDPKTVSIQSAPRVTEGEATRRNVAQFTSPAFDGALIKTLSASPFLNFCVSRVTVDTKVYLCSKELVLRKNGNKLVFIPRDSSPKDPFVEINGKKVALQGLVYLNDEKADLLMRTQLRSGETLEVMTKRKSVDFLDITQAQEPESLTLVTRGAEPVPDPSVKKVTDETYQLSLPRSRPIYYLLAEGGIPMRQEFLIKGDIPKEDLRLQVDRGYTLKTYSSSVSMSGPIPEGISLSAHGKDSTVEAQGNRFQWHLKNLKTGDRNRRTMTLQKDGKNYVAATEVARGRANEARLTADVRIPSFVASSSLLYRRWLGDLFWLPSSVTSLRWALEGSYIIGFNNTNEIPKIGGMILGLSMRFSQGFAEELRGTGLRLLYGQLKFADEGISSPAIEVFHQRAYKTSISDGLEVQGRFWLGGGSDVKLKTSWSLDVVALTELRPHLHLRWGGGILQWKTEPALPKEPIDLNATVGLISFF